MSRNTATHDPAEPSFAGLLENLTGRFRPEPEGQKSGPISASKAGSGSIAKSVSGSGASQGTRALLPVAELNGAPGATRPDSTTLSYEKALRIHARHRTPPDGNLNPPGIGPAKPESRRLNPSNLNPSGVEAVSKRDPIPTTKKAAPVKPGRGFGPTPAAPKSLPQPPAATQSPVEVSGQSLLKPGTKSSPPSRKPSSVRPHAPQSQRAAAAVSASPLLGKPTRGSTPRKSLRKSKSETASQSDARMQRPPRSVLPPTPSHGVSAQMAFPQIADRTERYPGEANPQRYDLQLNPSAQMNQIDLIDQRKAIVSVRLTDVEFALLRDRAGESGISVSAYMRSCVLEADALRAQVKKALADLRIFGAMPDSHRFSGLADTGGGSENIGAWFRFLFRSAGIVLSSLLPFRRSA